MKKLLCIILISTALAGCKENINNGFESEGAVYFQLNRSQWSDQRDSISYSFVGNPDPQATLDVRVMLMGDAAEHARQVRVAVDATRTTATEGTHYKALEGSYTLPAGAFYTDIPLTLYKTDDLEERSRTLTLVLEPTAGLGLGVTARTTARIIISNTLTRPNDWDDLMVYLFGPWSRVKHEKCVELTGITFEEGASYDFTYVTNAAKLVNRWFTENYPVRDENGDVIEPWI